MTYPIPEAALDDRLACVGTSGSGKTYAMGTAVEKLLHRKARAVIADPLGVWWGLRLRDDETPSRFNVVIFGGPHGDLPLTEHAGAVIGEAAATMAESCILDLSELGTKAAERRFMLAFLTALYRKATGEPVHLILDEADMWAPQQLRDKEGEAAKLLGMMETIVRRGRIKGFIPWMITQRPAVLNKDVLSQVDGVIAMKLVATQDRNALDEWIAGSADKAEAARIKGDMPGLQLGQAIVWLPGRGVLHTAQFPKKVTFDSSRTPKRGEAKRTLSLKPLDVGALKDRLSSVEAEVAAADPRKLKARIAELERQVKLAPAVKPDQKLIDEAHNRGHQEGYAEGRVVGRFDGITEMGPTVDQLRAIADGIENRQALAQAALRRPIPSVPASTPREKPVATAAPPRANGSAAAGEVTGLHAQILGAIAWWNRLGHLSPTREMIAAILGKSASGGYFSRTIGELKTSGLVTYPVVGAVSLTPEGEAAAPPPPAGSVSSLISGVLAGLHQQIYGELHRHGAITREDLAAALGKEADGGYFARTVGELKTLKIIDYPAKGQVQLSDWARGDL